MDWIWLIVALLVGLAVGGLVAWMVVKRRYGDRESVVELRREHDRYKGKVTEHFVETADLVNTLTRNYKRVYDHLEAGAYELVGEETLRRELDAPAEAPVMLEYLGQRRTDGPEAPEARRPDAAAGGVTSGASATATPDEAKPPKRGTPSATAAASPGDSDDADSPPADDSAKGADPDDAGPERANAHRTDPGDRTRSAG